MNVSVLILGMDGHKSRVTNCLPWVPERVLYFSAFPPQINSENASSQKEINYPHWDIFIHCSVDQGNFCRARMKKALRKKTAEFLRIKNGILLNSQKAENVYE